MPFLSIDVEINRVIIDSGLQRNEIKIRFNVLLYQ